MANRRSREELSRLNIKLDNTTDVLEGTVLKSEISMLETFKNIAERRIHLINVFKRERDISKKLINR